MVEYLLIEDAKIARKGSIIAEVIALGDVATGTSEKGAWSKQDATLKDNSGIQKLTLWNADIGQLDLHNFYKIENPFWTEYKGEPQISFGQYYKLYLANREDLLPAQEGQSSIQTEQTQETDQRQPATTIPAIPESLADFIGHETLVMLQIELVVRKTMTDYRPNNVEALNDQKIGMFVKEIYREARKTNLIKASNMK